MHITTRRGKYGQWFIWFLYLVSLFRSPLVLWGVGRNPDQGLQLNQLRIKQLGQGPRVLEKGEDGDPWKGQEYVCRLKMDFDGVCTSFCFRYCIYCIYLFKHGIYRSKSKHIFKFPENTPTVGCRCWVGTPSCQLGCQVKLLPSPGMVQAIGPPVETHPFPAPEFHLE